MSTDNRPMSPHLDIYRWRITMLSSILHRASGAFIAFGLFVLVIKLSMLALEINELQGVFLKNILSMHDSSLPEPAKSGIVSNVFWFIWSVAVYYHLCNGIRHLVWDAGHGFAVTTASKSAMVVIVVAVILTCLTWLVVFI